MYILDANAYARNPSGAQEKIQQLIDGVGGEMLVSRLWIEQKLAYPIKGRHKGVYWLSYVRMDSAKMNELNRACQLSDLILRHLVVKVDERLVEPLIAAATGKASEDTPATASEAKEDKPSEEASKVEADQAAATVDG